MELENEDLADPNENHLLALAFAFLLAGLIAGLLQSARAQDCASLTGRDMQVLARAASLPPGTAVRALTPGGDCAGEATYTGEPIVLTAWGADSLSAALLGRTGGFQEGEPVELWAIEPDVPPQLAYRVYPYDLTYDGLSAGSIFHADDAVASESLVPLPVDTARVFWVEQQIEPAETTWTAALQVTSPVPLGAVLIAIKPLSMPGDTLRPTIHAIVPSADTLVIGDTLVAWWIGAGSRTVTWIISGTGSGALDLFRILGTDRQHEHITMQIEGQTYAMIHPYEPPVAGDVNDDGVVDLADVRIVAEALVVDATGALERVDVWPWPEGDGQITISDFHVLNEAAVLKKYPDGTEAP